MSYCVVDDHGQQVDLQGCQSTHGGARLLLPPFRALVRDTKVEGPVEINSW